MNAIDIFLLVVIGAFALWGFSKGLISSIIGLAGYVAAFLAAKMWGNSFGEFLKGTKLMESLSRSINSNLANIGISGMDPSQTSSVLNSTEFGETLSKNPLFQSIFKGDVNIVGPATEGITALIVNVVSISLGFLIIFFGVKIIISLVGAGLNGLSKISKPLSFVNRFFGLLTGTVMGAAISTIIAVFVLPLFMTYSTNLYTMAQLSVVSKYLTEFAGRFF